MDPIPADEELTPIDDTQAPPPDADLTPLDTGPAPTIVQGGKNIDVPDVEDPEAAWRASQQEKVAADLQKREQENTILREGFKTSVGANLKDEEAIQQLATNFKIPTRVAAIYKADLSAAWKASQFDPEKFRKAEPDLAQMLLEHPEMGPEVHQQVGVSKLVKALRAATDLYEDVTDNPTVQDVTTLFTGGAAGPGPEAPKSGSPEEAAAYVAEQARKTAARAERDAPKMGTFLEDPVAKDIRENHPWLAPFARLDETWQQLNVSALSADYAMKVLRGPTTPEPGLLSDLTGGYFGDTPPPDTDFQAKLDDLKRQIIDAKRTATPRNYGPAGEGTGTDILTGAASSAIALTGGYVAPPGAGAVAATTAGGVGAGIIGRLPGGKYLVGAGLARGTFQLEFGSTFDDSANWRTDTGQQLTERERAGASAIYAALATAQELGELGALHSLGKAAGALEGGADLGTKAGLKQAFKRLLIGDPAFRSFMVKTGVALVGEPGEEFSQALTQSATEFFAKSLKQGEFQTHGIGQPEVDDALTQAGMAIPFSVTQAGGAVVVGRMLGSVQRDDNVTGNKQAEALAGLTDSPAAKGLPKVVAGLIADTTEKTGRPVTHLYVDAEILGTTQLFQSAKPEEAAAENIDELLGPGGQQKLEDAIATGGKVEIPAALYASKWAGTPLAEKLAEDTTTRAGHLTAREMAENPGLIEEQAKRIVEEAEAVKASNEETVKRFTEMEAELAKIEVRGKPIGAQKAKAATSIWRAVDRMTRSAFGDEVADSELAELRFQLAQGGTVAEGLMQGAVATSSGPLSDRAAEADPVQVATDHYIDRLTNLRNFNGWEASPRKPGPVWAITIPDIKPFNDDPKGGHDTSNALLRHVSPIVAAADSEAARKGTVFLGHGDATVLSGVLAGIQKMLPPGVHIEGAIGANTEAAFKAMDARVNAQREAKNLPPRGKTNFDLKNLPALEQSLAQSVSTEPNISPEMLKTAAAMSPEEVFSAYHDRDAPGILSAVGFEHTGPKAFVASADVKGLKADFNERFGQWAGDLALAKMAEVAQDIGGHTVDFAHFSGDEYAGKHDNREELKTFFEDLQAELRRRPVHVQYAGRTYLQVVELRVGIGEKTYGAADRVLNAAKAGERAGGDQHGKAGQDGVVGSGKESVGTGAEGAGPRLPGLHVLEARRARAQQRGSQGQAFVDRSPGGRAQETGDGGAAGRGGRELTLYEQNPQLQEAIDAQRAEIARMTNKVKQAWASKQLDFILGKGERPKNGGLSQRIRDGVSNDLMNAGFPDPELKFDLDGTVGRPTADGANHRKVSTDETRSFVERVAFQNQIKGNGSGGGTGGSSLHAGPADAPRGSVQHIRDGVRDIFRIALNPTADLSTFLHESSHVFLELFADLATRADAPEQLKTDYAEALRWLGIEDPTKVSRDENGWSFKREHHEKWADGFLAYFREGKAPSEALRSSFKRFSDWLKAIYKSASQLGVELSPEIRGVFDRLLATDEEIADTKRAMGKPLFGSLADALAAGLSPENFADYLKDQEAATSHAERLAKLRINKETLREKDAAWKKALAGFVKVAEDEYEALPARKAQQVLLGQGTDEFLKVKVPLDRASVEAAVGEAAARKFHLVAEGGINPDDIAGELGFDTGADMLKAVEVLPAKDLWAKKRGEFRMAEANPGLLEQRDQLRELVGKGLHGDETARWLMKEIAAISKKGPNGTVQQAPIQSIELAAKMMVSRTLVRNLSPARALAAERKAANAAVKLLAKGDFAAVLVQKEKQLLNMFLYRELLAAKEATDAAKKKIENTSEGIRSNLGKAAPEYRDVHDAIARAVGLASRFDAAGNLIPPGKTLTDLTALVIADGQQLDVDLSAIQALLSKPKSWKSLTFAEASTVSDAITNIRHLANQALDVEILGKRQSKLSYWKEVADRAASVRKPVPAEPSRPEDKSLGEKARHLARGGSSLLQNIETIAHMLDGGPEGPARRLLVESRRAARDVETRLTVAVLNKVRDAVKAMPKEIWAKRDERVPEIDKLLPENSDRFLARYTRSTLWTLFLNQGNEGNKQRIRDGNGWTDAQVQQALNMLDPGEAKFLQGILDTTDSLRPDLAAAYEKRTGLQMGKVEASTITINGEHFRGGYWPIRYDSAKSAQGRVQEINDIKDLFPTNRTPTTKQGMTKGRLDSVSAPVDLSWNVVPAHLADVIHTIAFDEWVRQAGSLILKPRVETPGFTSFSETASKFLGPEREQSLKPWLQDVASSTADSAAGHGNQFIREVGGAISGVVARAAIGLNYPSLMRHMFDAWTPLADSESVHWTRILSAYTQMWNPGTWKNPEFALSKALAYHHATHADNLRKELQLIGGTKWSALNEKVLAVGFAAHEFVHSFTARVAFKAAYDQAIGDGKTVEEAAKRADDVVERHFPNADIGEKPPILRTKYGFASAAMFYGYASKIQNLRSRAMDDAARMWSPPDPINAKKKDAAVTLAGKMIALSAISTIGLYLAGKGPKKDEDAAEWASEELMLAPLDDVWFVGPLAKAGLTGHKPSAVSAPALSYAEEMLRKVQSAMTSSHQTKSDAEVALTGVKLLVSLMGYSGAANRVGDAASSMVTGETEPANPIDAAGKLFYGNRKNQSRNPINDLADLLQ